MAQLQLWTSDKATISWSHAFLQLMLNRLAFGYFRHQKGTTRHDAPSRNKQYLPRLKQAIDTYEKTGNVEFLVDVANYAALEWEIEKDNRLQRNIDSHSRTEFF